MRTQKTEQLFEHKYPNGNRVQVTNKGVTLWDDKTSQWVVDASLLIEDDEIRIYDVINWKPCDYKTFKSLHSYRKKRATKKRAKKKRK